MANDDMESEKECGETCDLRYLVVNPEGGSMVDLVHFLVSGETSYKFLIQSSNGGEIKDGHQRALGPIPGDRRWVILVAILVRRIIAFFGKPIEWFGILIEFLLNLLFLNGGILGLLLSLLSGNVVMPERGSDRFISAIGHLDRRVNLHKFLAEADEGIDGSWKDGSGALYDLCAMASKLAYENDKVVANVVNNNWKMHFVEFYNCWNEYQKERSTQAFILCDKPKDASIVLISFRGTELFDPDDWSTDLDYSWCEIPKMGKIHLGFLEALGLGNRKQVSSFKFHLQRGNFLERSYCNSRDIEESAYYCIRNKLKILLHEHKNVKFLVTGHSLGGALAILFPAMLLFHKEEKMLEKLLGVYTFGQPRVGDQQLESFMKAHLCHPVTRYYRMVYCNDLVPRLPSDNKTFLYKHFGRCVYYNSLYIEEDVDEEPNRNYFSLRYLIPEHLNAVWELIRSLTMGYVYGPEYKETWCSILLRLCGLTSYIVGGQSFSAAEIEFIMLKMKPPMHRLQLALALAIYKLKISEKHSKYSIDRPEPLVLFALCCGMYSSPAVRVFTADDVLDELHKSMQDHVRASVGISEKGELLVPKLLHSLTKGIVEDCLLVDWICQHISPNQVTMVQDSMSRWKRRLLSDRSFDVVQFDSRSRYLFLPDDKASTKSPRYQFV